MLSQVFSGRGLGRRLFQKGGLPSVPPVPTYGRNSATLVTIFRVAEFAMRLSLRRV